MKRKHGNRKDWPRIESQLFHQQYLKDESFEGYATLLHFKKVNQPLIAKYTPEAIELVSNESFMLQHFPIHGNYCLTTFISPEKEIVQWYIDITNSIGFEEDVVYMDDLYLDLIVFPNMTVVEKDIDEIEEAFANNQITEQQYRNAWETFDLLKEKIHNNTFQLLEQSSKHFEILLDQMNRH